MMAIDGVYSWFNWYILIFIKINSIWYNCIHAIKCYMFIMGIMIIISSMNISNNIIIKGSKFIFNTCSTWWSNSISKIINNWRSNNNWWWSINIFRLVSNGFGTIITFTINIFFFFIICSCNILF